jgi:predicted MPP superfamily phosphohydrolase
MKLLPRKISRREFLGLGALGGLSYMRFGEPNWIGVGRHEVPFGGGTPVKMLHLSDLHASEFVSLDFIRKAVRIGLEEQPDVVCLTGDFITRLWEDWEGYSQALALLAEHAPTFACLGNHDGGAWSIRAGGYPNAEDVREMLARAGLTLLHNANTEITVRGRTLRFAGVGDSWAREMEPALAFANVPADAATIVLSHNPDTKKALVPFPWKLMLCGHTHGGQLDLPMLGTPFAPVSDHRFVRGLHRWEGRWLHVTRGCHAL